MKQEKKHKNRYFQATEIVAGYGKNEILHGVSFEIKPGTLNCFLGANGSGKTTLLKCLANQIPHQGQCFFKEQVLEKKSVRELAQSISYLPQKSGITLSLPVLDVVLMGVNPRLKLLQNPTGEQKEKAKEWIGKVGLLEKINTDYLCLSEGQKQLVLLARMMLEETGLFLLDEPDSALDIPNRYFLMRCLQEMVRKEKKAAILCLHDPVLAMEFCDQLLLLKDGNIIEVISPQEETREKMETAFRKIYGNIALMECFDKKGNKHYSIMGTEGKCKE